MTVSIDPSEVRRRSSDAEQGPPQSLSQNRKPRLRLPVRAILVAGIGTVGLAAFSFGAFSFFSDLADPRTRFPRPAPMAAKMPDLKDGIPALVPEQVPAGSQRQAALDQPPAPVLDLPRPTASRAAEPEPIVQPPRAAVTEPPAEELPTGSVGPARRTPGIPEMQAAALIAPARAAATIAPTKAETVRAKAEQPGRFVSLDKAEPTPSAPAPKQKPLAKAAQKPGAKAVADASPAPAGSASSGAATPALPKATSDDSEVLGVKIPGSGRLRDGVKAMFGGDSENE